AWTPMEQLAAGVLKSLPCFVADLVNRLQAIGREPRRGNEDSLGPEFRQALQCPIGVRFQPLIAPEKRLKRLGPAFARPAEAADECGSSSFNVRGIRIAALGVRNRDAVKAQDVMVR